MDAVFRGTRAEWKARAEECEREYDGAFEDGFRRGLRVGYMRAIQEMAIAGQDLVAAFMKEDDSSHSIGEREL